MKSVRFQVLESDVRTDFILICTDFITCQIQFKKGEQKNKFSSKIRSTTCLVLSPIKHKQYSLLLCKSGHFSVVLGKAAYWITRIGSLKRLIHKMHSPNCSVLGRSPNCMVHSLPYSWFVISPTSWLIGCFVCHGTWKPGNLTRTVGRGHALHAMYHCTRSHPCPHSKQHFITRKWTKQLKYPLKFQSDLPITSR